MALKEGAAGEVEHLYAVYVHSAFAEMAPDEMKATPLSFRPTPKILVPEPDEEFEEWRLGWFCSPLSRYLMGLEASRLREQSWGYAL